MARKQKVKVSSALLSRSTDLLGHVAKNDEALLDTLLVGVSTRQLLNIVHSRLTDGGPESLADVTAEARRFVYHSGLLTTEGMLKAIEVRGGHPGALAAAALLCLKKSADYNHGKGFDPHNVDRSGYFPFGTVSYAQMLHTKSQRFNALVQKIIDGGQPNFEGLRDTALDIINYAGFFVADKKASGE